MVLTLASAVLVAVIAALSQREIEAWTPWLSERIRRLAVRQLRGPIRERLDEEWAAFLEEVPGNLGKFLCAWGFLSAACRMKFLVAVRSLTYTSAGVAGRMLFRGGVLVARLGKFLAQHAKNTRMWGSINKALTVAFLTLLLWTLKILYWRLALIEEAEDRERERKRLDEIFEPFVRQLTEFFMPSPVESES